LSRARTPPPQAPRLLNSPGGARFAALVGGLGLLGGAVLAFPTPVGELRTLRAFRYTPGYPRPARPREEGCASASAPGHRGRRQPQRTGPPPRHATRPRPHDPPR